MNYRIFFMNCMDGFNEMANIVFVLSFTGNAKESCLIPKLTIFRTIHLQEKMNFILECFP